MSERIVNDPSQHGWTQDGDRWIWAGESSGGGGIQDGDTEGQVTTWSGEAWTPESSLTIDATGDATFTGDVACSLSKPAGGLHTWLWVHGSDDQIGLTINRDNNRLVPYANSKDVMDLGAATSKFKDGYFSGTIDAAGFTVNGEPIGGGGGGFENISGDVNGNGYGWRHDQSTGNVGVFITNNGQAFCPSTADSVSLGTTQQRWKDLHLSGEANATDFIASSDERLKDNISTAPVGLIDSLKGREWDWSESGEKGSGVVAQELEQVLPHLVHEDDEGMKSVAYNGLIAYLIEEIKDLKAQVEALK